MCRPLFHAVTIILGAFLVSATQPVFGQGVGIAPHLDVRPGTEIRVDQLGAFLAKKLFIGETEKNLANPAASQRAAPRGWALALRVELISREEGVVADYESQTVEVEAGRMHNASTWFARPNVLNEKLFAPLKPAEFVIFRIGQKTIIGFDRHTIPGECGDATHAVQVTLVSDDKQFSGPDAVGKSVSLCLKAGR